MKTRTAVLNGRPDAGNPRVRLDGGKVASAKPRRGARLYTKLLMVLALMPLMALADTWNDPNTGIAWTYTISDGEAQVGPGSYSSPAISKTTTGAITIPSTLGGYPVTSIGDSAFQGCSGLTSVTIPSSVTNIVVESVFGREGRLLPSTNGMTTVVFPAQGLLPRRTLGSRLARPLSTVSQDADSAEEKAARKARAAQRSQFIVGSSTAEFGRKRDALFMDIVREAEICQTNLAEYATYPYLPDAMSVVSNFCEKEGCVVVDVGHHFGAWRQGCEKKAYVVTCNMEDSSRFVPCRFEGADGFRVVSRDGVHTNVAYRGAGPICCYDAEGRFEAMYDSVDKLPGMQDCWAADLKCNYEEQDRWMAAHGFSDAGTGRDAEQKLDAARTNVIVRLKTLRTILSKFPQWKAGNKWYQVCDVRADLSCPSPTPEINTNDTVFVKMNERFEILGRSQDQLIEEFVRVLTGLKFGSSTETNGVLDLKLNLGSYETCTFACVSDGGAINRVTLIAEFDPSCEMKTIHEKLDQGLSTLASAIGLDRDALTYEGSEKGSGLRRPGNQDRKSVQSFSQRFTITRDKRLFGGYEYVVTISDSRNNARRPGGLLGLRPGGLWGGSLLAHRLQRQQEAQAAAAKQPAEQAAREAERIEQRQQHLAIPKGTLPTSPCVGEKTYWAIDLQTGASEYFDTVPIAGWGDEYKTTKLLMRRIESGDVKMGGKKPVTISKPFYIGVFEVTQKQYELINGSNPSSYKGDMRPVECVSYKDIRGTNKGAQWPNGTEFDDTSWIGKLKAKVGVTFDLPTESQWEYACRAGTTTSFNNGGSSVSDLSLVGRWYNNRTDGKGGYSEHTTVGSYLPNAWGLYDMHGNVSEWCLVRCGSINGDDPATDWAGAASGSYRGVPRGGYWSYDFYYCRSSARLGYAPSYRSSHGGFRLCCSAPAGLQ